jgi:hypothetical protein
MKQPPRLTFLDLHDLKLLVKGARMTTLSTVVLPNASVWRLPDLLGRASKAVECLQDREEGSRWSLQIPTRNCKLREVAISTTTVSTRVRSQTSLLRIGSFESGSCWG